MQVLVDTSVFSLSLRRPAKRLSKSQRAVVRELRELIADGRVVLLGIVRQELLTGIRDRSVFERLREYLRAFPDVPLDVEDYESAADFANRCRATGVQGSPVDFLICAAASGRGLAVMTTDRDFARYAKHLPIQLYEVGAGG